MNGFRWLSFALLQNKRLLSGCSFLLALLMIPLSVFGIRLFLREESGVLCIALCAEEAEDPAARAILERLKNADTVLQFSDCTGEEDAVEKIAAGECDAAWILRSDTEARIRAYCRPDGQKTPFLRILQREESVTANLAREKLYGAVFPEVIYAVLEGYITENLPELGLTEADIRGIYNASAGADSFVSYTYLESGGGNPDADYRTAPLRGLLAVIVVLCGLSAQMVFLADRKNGVLDWMPKRKQIFAGSGITLVAVTDAVLAVLLSMALSGSSLAFSREWIPALCLIPAAAAFCVLLGVWLASQEILGILIPFILLLMLWLSPIFFNYDMPILRCLQRLFPAYYYLNAFYGGRHILSALLYAAAVWGIARVTELFRRDRR